MWDFPHFVKAREIYFFIYLSTREKCLSRGFYLSREDWIPVDVFFTVYCTAAISLLRFWVLDTEFHNCFLEIFVSKVRIIHFLFSRVLCVLLLFNFVVGASRLTSHERRLRLCTWFVFFLS